jgi:enamine deaminase RidA (YjgF/YER057c/UK114 family)
MSTPAKNNPSTAEQKLQEFGIELPAPPEPFGVYAEAVQTGDLLFLTARLAAINALAVARQHLGSLDKVTRVVRLGVSVATSGDFRDHPKVADGASELLQNVFGKEKNPSRLVYGVASLPLGSPVELEIIFEVAVH